MPLCPEALDTAVSQSGDSFDWDENFISLYSIKVARFSWTSLQSLPTAYITGLQVQCVHVTLRNVAFILMTLCHFCYGYATSWRQWLFCCFDSLVLTTPWWNFSIQPPPLVEHVHHGFVSWQMAFYLVMFSMFIACNVTCSRSLLFYTSHFIMSLYQRSLLWVIGRMVLACSYTWSLLKCSTRMLNKINRKTGSMYLLVIQIWLCLFVEQALFEWYYHASLQKCQVILLWELFWWLCTWMWSAVFLLVNLEQSCVQKIRNWKRNCTTIAGTVYLVFLLAQCSGHPGVQFVH